MEPPKHYPLALSVLPASLEQSIPVHPHCCTHFQGPCIKPLHTPVCQRAGLPKCRVHQGWTQPCSCPLASVRPLALSACSHTVQLSIAAGITWRIEFAGAQSRAAMPAGFAWAGGQVLLPGPAGSSPLAFCLHEHCLGQRRGGADGAAGAARSWAGKADFPVSVVQCSHHPCCTLSSAAGRVPSHPASCPCHTQWLGLEPARRGRETEAGKETHR